MDETGDKKIVGNDARGEALPALTTAFMKGVRE
jgi:hypothetical protein